MAPINPKFVRMKKDGSVISVNPLCVKDHERLGWAVLEGAKTAVAPEPDAKENIPSKDDEDEKEAKGKGYLGRFGRHKMAVTPEPDAKENIPSKDDEDEEAKG